MSEYKKVSEKKIKLSKSLIIQLVCFAVLVVALGALVIKSSSAVKAQHTDETNKPNASLEEIKAPEELEPTATPDS